MFTLDVLNTYMIHFNANNEHTLLIYNDYLINTGNEIKH